MAEASIPVDLFNPGQVFACLGFLETADVLLGDAEGGFDWTNRSRTRFVLCAASERNPFEVVLEFLAHAKVQRCTPGGYSHQGLAKDDLNDLQIGESGCDERNGDEQNFNMLAGTPTLAETFPAREPDSLALPILLYTEKKSIGVTHWADGTDRNDFKLYSGNRSAERIAQAMLHGVRKKGAKAPLEQPMVVKGVAQLWQERRGALIEGPFEVLTPMGGSFNFDPRGAWTAIDAGYSPNDHKHQVNASPVVEILAAVGLENARPNEHRRRVRYSVWGLPITPMLARAALPGNLVSLPQRHFQFQLAMSGKNKVVTFANEESAT